MRSVDWIFGVAALCVMLSTIVMASTQDVLRIVFLFLFQCIGGFVLYVLLRATYLAVMQLVVYVGGSLVLLLYCTMTTQPRLPKKSKNWSPGRWGAAGLVMLIWVCLQRFVFFSDTIADGPLPKEQLPRRTLSDIGLSLMTTHAYALELMGILLLVALVGAVVLATAHDEA